MTKRLTRRDVFTKSLGIEFKAAPCGCESCAPTSTDPAKVQEAMDLYKRNQAFGAALDEGHGALALDAAAKSVRWMTGGRMDTNGKQQQPPIIQFYEDDGRSRTGYFDPLRPDEIHIRRGLSAEETIRTSIHECSHQVSNALWGGTSNEAAARIDEEYLTRRYLKSIKSERVS